MKIVAAIRNQCSERVNLEVTDLGAEAIEEIVSVIAGSGLSGVNRYVKRYV